MSENTADTIRFIAEAIVIIVFIFCVYKCEEQIQITKRFNECQSVEEENQ